MQETHKEAFKLSFKPMDSIQNTTLMQQRGDIQAFTLIALHPPMEITITNVTENEIQVEEAMTRITIMDVLDTFYGQRYVQGE